MKILAFAYACEPDKGSEPGAGWCWVRILAGLGEVTVITRSNNRPAIERGLQGIPEKENLNFVYVDPPKFLTFWKKGQRGVRLFYFLWQICAARRGIRLAKDVDFDFVWHLTLANAWLGSLAFLVGPPLIYGPVGGGVACPIRLRSSLGLRGNVYESIRAVARMLCRYVNPLARMSWRRATLILAQNPETIRWLPGRHRKKAKVFPHAVLQDPNDCASNIAREPGQRAIFAGRLIPWKGVELAIRAIGQAPGWHLDICGSGPDRRRLEDLVEDLRIGPRVTFVGHVPREDLLARMRDDCDVLLFPSFHDDSPLTVVEALASGLPAIVLGVGGPPILAGDAGIAVSIYQGRGSIVRSLADVLNTGNFPSRSAAVERGQGFTIDNRRAALLETIENMFKKEPACRP